MFLDRSECQVFMYMYMYNVICQEEGKQIQISAPQHRVLIESKALIAIAVHGN